MKELQLHAKIAAHLNIDLKHVTATIELLDEGGTIPFISRYRKEVTGSIDEVQVMQILVYSYCRSVARSLSAK